MWSATNIDLVKQLVLTQRKDYPYYVAHTISDGNNMDDVTIRVYFSDSEIVANGLYEYEIKGNSFYYDIITSGYRDRGNNDVRLSTHSFSGRLKINVFEFVYTNAVSESYTIQPDILAERGVSNETFQGFGFVFVLAVLVVFFSRWFVRSRGSLI